jgi:hypothetical protein
MLMTMIGLICLSACQTAPEPTPVLPTLAAPPGTTAVAPPTIDLPQSPRGTDIPPVEATPQGQAAVATFASSVSQNVQIAAPGTLTYAEATAEVLNINGTIYPTPQFSATLAPLAQSFQRLIFTQQGGAGGQTLTVELRADGTLTRNGTPAALARSEVAAVIDSIDRIRLFDIAGWFTGPVNSADAYAYSLVVEAADRQLTLEAQEAYTPAELLSFFFNVSQLGLRPFPTG